MARPKKEESIRRTSNVMVRFSSIEYELVAGYAKDAGYLPLFQGLSQRTPDRVCQCRQHPRCRTKSAAARTAAHAKIRAIPLTHFFKVT